MNSSRLIARVAAILTRPKTEWPVIAAEPENVASLYTNYIIFLAAVPPLIGFLRSVFIGVGSPFAGVARMGMVALIGLVLMQYVLSLLGVYLMSLVINALAPTFGGVKNQVQALKTIAYAYTATWVATIGTLLPWIALLIMVAGVGYGIYLMYLGLPITMRCPAQKATAYTVVSIIVATVLSWLIGALVARALPMTALY